MWASLLLNSSSWCPVSDEEPHGLELLKFPSEESLCILLAAQWERFSAPLWDCGKNGTTQRMEVIHMPKRNPVPGNAAWHCPGRRMGEQGCAHSTSPCRLQQRVLHRIKPQTCGGLSLFHVYFHGFLLSPTYQLKFPTHNRNKILGKWRWQIRSLFQFHQC